MQATDTSTTEPETQQEAKTVAIPYSEGKKRQMVWSGAAMLAAGVVGSVLYMLLRNHSQTDYTSTLPQNIAAGLAAAGAVQLYNGLKLRKKPFALFHEAYAEINLPLHSKPKRLYYEKVETVRYYNSKVLQVILNTGKKENLLIGWLETPERERFVNLLKAKIGG